MRRGVGGELVDDRAAPRDRGEGLVGQPDARAVPGDGDDVRDRDGTGADDDGGDAGSWFMTPRARRRS